MSILIYVSFDIYPKSYRDYRAPRRVDEPFDFPQGLGSFHCRLWEGAVTTGRSWSWACLTAHVESQQRFDLKGAERPQTCKKRNLWKRVDRNSRRKKESSLINSWGPCLHFEKAPPIYPRKPISRFWGPLVNWNMLNKSAAIGGSRPNGLEICNLISFFSRIGYFFLRIPLIPLI